MRRGRDDRRQLLRRAAASGLGLLVLAGLLLADPAPVATAAPAATGASVTLLDQSPWLGGQGIYRFDLRLGGAAPTDRLEVRVYGQMGTRTGFEQAAAGNINDFAFYDSTSPVAAYHPTAGATVSIEMPVNQSPPAGDPLTAAVPIGETGVFPVRFSLYDQNGTAIGTPLVTFITIVQQAQSAGGITPISAALIIPVSTAPTVGPGATIGAPRASEIRRLAQLASVLAANTSVPVSLRASPLTLDQLAASNSPLAEQALANLASATSAGTYQVLPATFAPVSMSGLSEAGLAGEIDQQLQAGSATLKARLGQAPDGHTWVLDGPLDSTTLEALVGRGATRLITPDRDLTPLTNPVKITFAGSTTLAEAGQTVQSVAADTGLTQDFTRSDSPVLAANQLLAELAVIYTEAPNALSKRGVAILPPAGWSTDPVFVKTLLEGLRGNPLVSATTATKLFDSIGTPQDTRNLARPRPAPPEAFLSTNSTRIQQDRAAIGDLVSVYAGDKAIATKMRERLLLAESGRLSDDQRSSILAVVEQAAARVRKAATLPAATSITLTSAKAQLPVTVLAPGGDHPTIELVLTSARLVFQAFSPPGGTCSVMSDSTEICTLTLANQNTTIKVPVEARSSGVFPLDVCLYPPRTAVGSCSPNNGYPLIVHRKDTVRSTAVSGVAVILIAVAGAALILWWGRDLRRGRRPKGMVPAPTADTDGPIGLSDADLDRFFDDPPPRSGPEGMSPSTVSRGPSSATDPHGRGRETRE